MMIAAAATFAHRSVLQNFVSANLKFDGADGSTTIVDEKGHTFTASGNAQIDTAQSKFGGSSLLVDGTGDYASSGDHADFELGSGIHAMRAFVRFNSLPGAGTIASWFTKFSGADHSYFFGLQNNAGTYNLLFAASDDNDGINEVLAVGAWTPSINTWYCVLVIKTGGNVYGYVDAVQKCTAADAITYNNNANALLIGASNGGSTNFMNGWIDDAVLLKGAVLDIDVPTMPFPKF
jgi:hypothetical protein